MDAITLLEYQWPYLQSFLASDDVLERSAREKGALVRRRGVPSASALLRLALAYSFCGMPLRQTAAWAKVAGVAEVSDVALMKRLRAADSWLGGLLGLKLATTAPPPSLSSGKKYRLRLVDATCISRPGSKRTDWRIHMGFNLESLAIDSIELTDEHGAETLHRFAIAPGDVVLADAGYAHREALAGVVESEGHFIVRIHWSTMPLEKPDGTRFDTVGALRGLEDGQVGEFVVRTAADRKRKVGPVDARLVAIRMTEAAAEAARTRLLRNAAKKGHRSIDPRAVESAGYIYLLTSLPADALPAPEVLELYRFRWQIELAFKRMKSLLFLDEMPARDPPLARSYIYAKLLAALLIEEFTRWFLDFSPWGYPLPRSLAVHLENPASAC